MIWPNKNKRIGFSLILILGLVVFFQNCSKTQFNESVNPLVVLPGRNTLNCEKEFFLNGDFEESDDGIGSVFSIALKDLTAPQWDLYAGIPKWEALNWSFPGYIEIHAETTHAAASGKRYIELDRYGAAAGIDGSISQKIKLTSGNYKISYSFRARPSDSASSILDISWNENLLQSETVLPADNSWQNKSVDLIGVDGGTHVLRFKASGLSDGLGPHLDQVSIKKICPSL